MIMKTIINNNNNNDNNHDADDDGDDDNYWELHNIPILVSEALNPQKDSKIPCSHTGSSLFCLWVI